MIESLFEKLVETSWRRKLTPEEEAQLRAWLARHPEDAKRWETEAGLNVALERLEVITPSSNFTSRVMELVELETRAAARADSRGSPPTRSFVDRLFRWFSLPRRHPGWALAVVLVVSALGYHEYRDYASGQVERGVRSLTEVAAATPPDVFEDFEAIRKFSQVELDETDEALFALVAK